MTRYTFSILWFLAIHSAACGGNTAQEPINETPIHVSSEDVVTPSKPVSPAPATTTFEAPPPQKSVPEGAISRTALNRIIADGPAAVLARVTTKPHRNSGRFVGFEIMGFSLAPPTAVDLKIGDVIIAINGLRIVKPEDYFRVFEELKVASELRFEFLRNNIKEERSYPIVE